jgi:hypothetical protein
MIFHYDLAQAEPIIRDYVVVGTSDILRGAVVARDGAITTALNRFGLQNAAAAVIDDVVGVAAELYDYSAHYSGVDQPQVGQLGSGTNAATAVATGVSNYMKVIINPLAVWLCEYSQQAADDTVNTAASTGGKVTTATFTTDREGDWIYVTNVGSTAGGAGNLSQIGASTSTTSVTACTSYDDNMATTNTSDTFIVISKPFQPLVAGGSLDLSAASSVAGAQIIGSATSGTGAILPIENYISDKNTPIQPLRVERHSGITYDAATAHLYADAFLLDHILLGGGIATAPQIA